MTVLFWRKLIPQACSPIPIYDNAIPPNDSRFSLLVASCAVPEPANQCIDPTGNISQTTEITSLFQRGAEHIRYEGALSHFCSEQGMQAETGLQPTASTAISSIIPGTFASSKASLR
jgi:hypothetical protein